MAGELTRHTHVTNRPDSDTHERAMPLSSDRSKVLTQGDQSPAFPMNCVGARGNMNKRVSNYSDHRS